MGFEKDTVLEEGVHESPNIIDITPISSIRISCNIVNGFIVNGQYSNTVYEFPYSTEFGNQINIIPNPIINTELFTKTFNEITLTFTDNNNNPVNFGYESFNCVYVLFKHNKYLKLKNI